MQESLAKFYMPDKPRNRKGEKNFKPEIAKAVNRSSVYKETKTCKICGQEFQRRKKWADEKNWSEVKFCSKRCRKTIS